MSNAGYAVLGAVEDVDLDEVRAMFETNLFGAAAVLQQALPPMREAGGGVGGVRVVHRRPDLQPAARHVPRLQVRPLGAWPRRWPWRARPFGIRVVSIEPGMVDTDFPRATRLTGAAGRGEGPYAALGAELRAGFGALARGTTPPPERTWPRRSWPPRSTRPAPSACRWATTRACSTALRESTTDERVWQHELLGFLEIDWLDEAVIAVVAPAPFKGALTAAAAARAIGAGLRLARGVETRLTPVADGGEGTLDALVAAAGGRRRGMVVPDPLGRPVEAALGELPGGVAVVELAQASGYERLRPEERDPEATTTRGHGGAHPRGPRPRGAPRDRRAGGQRHHRRRPGSGPGARGAGARRPGP